MMHFKKTVNIDAYIIYFGLSPLPVRVTTRIITFLVGDPYKPSFPLLLGGGTTQNILHIEVYPTKNKKHSRITWNLFSTVYSFAHINNQWSGLVHMDKKGSTAVVAASAFQPNPKQEKPPCESSDLSDFLSAGIFFRLKGHWLQSLGESWHFARPHQLPALPGVTTLQRDFFEVFPRKTFGAEQRMLQHQSSSRRLPWLTAKLSSTSTISNSRLKKHVGKCQNATLEACLICLMTMAQV